MPRREHSTRRPFLKHSAALAAPLIVPASVLGRQDKPAPSRRITLGVIGTGNEGFHDMRGFLGDGRVFFYISLRSGHAVAWVARCLVNGYSQ